ncbi:MAG: ABC transporter permease, partial [Bryobacteraceae bacterium]
MRSLLSILLIGVPVTLILTLVGLTQGMLEDGRNRQRGAGADAVIRASTAKSVINFGPSSMPAAMVGAVERQPHVKLAMGVIMHAIDLPLAITGIDLAKFNRMTGGFTYDAGGPFQGPDDILVDRYYARQHHLAVGQILKLLNHDWRVA